MLAAMRKAKDKIVRRAGSFGAEGVTFLGKNGFLYLGKSKFWFTIVNDWLYWFKEQIALTTTPEIGSQLLKHVGNVWMARCNVVARNDNEMKIIQPTGQNLSLRFCFFLCFFLC